eukprot:441132-Pleurochrysis_carterae.AAC.1
MGVARRTLPIRDARGRSRSVPTSVSSYWILPDVLQRAPVGLGAAGGRPPCCVQTDLGEDDEYTM